MAAYLQTLTLIDKHISHSAIILPEELTVKPQKLAHALAFTIYHSYILWKHIENRKIPSIPSIRPYYSLNNEKPVTGA